MMIKYLIPLLFPFSVWSQINLDTSEVMNMLTSSTWNVSYNITPEGERIDEESAEKIRSSWVIFNKDGSFEMPAGVTGKTVGKWTYNPETKAIQFAEKNGKYRAIIDEISELSLVLHYVDNGGFKIGLIHHVFIPTEKSAEEVDKIVTSGRWNVLIQRFDQIEDRTLPENIENTWFEFNSDNTYKRSEVIDGDIVEKEGYWFIDEEFRLNLDGSEMSIYSVVGDKSRMILTSTADGIKIIECRKAK